MAWVGNSRCLYCRERLPLYRFLAAEEFCSTAHREAFLDDQTRLGLERLVGAREELSRMLGPVVQPVAVSQLSPSGGGAQDIFSTIPAECSSIPSVAYPSFSARP